ncbi:hypothetical protein BV20DRAFT_971472 [Pilatotrama ljubarskyi]|nr:hypothetical protein BV20DRAFT_971472 [Pilatotrama ljubarskyi]
MERSAAASRALLCPEILVEIFDYLTPGRPLDENALPKDRVRRREAQRTLARAARVCHAFSGPALSVLWRVTDGLVSLLSILPSFTRHADKSYVLTRDVSDAEWARFQEYAWRVRELYTSGDKHISPWVWTFLSRRCTAGFSLIPQLQRLESLRVSASEPGRIVLLTPTLRHLVLSVEPALSGTEEAQHIITTVMEVAQKVCIPHLASLRITSHGYLTASMQPVLPPWPQLSHLQELEIMTSFLLDAEILQTLSGFSGLRKLTVSARLLFDVTALPITRPRSPFSALRDLKIIGAPRVCAIFLEAVAPVQLDSLALRFTEWHLMPQDDPELALLMAALTTTATRALRRLEFAFASYQLPTSLLEVVQPALALDGLTHVTFRMDKLQDSLPVTDAALCTMAQAWPNLVDFEMSFGESDGDEEDLAIDDPPSAQALILFAQRHPRLVRLVWPYVCMTEPFGLPELRTVPLLDHGLQVFRTSLVEKDGLPKHRAYAMLLDRLFPNLDLSDADAQYPGTKMMYYRERHQNWHDVEQLLLAIQDGRRGAHRLPVSPSAPIQVAAVEDVAAGNGDA